MAKKVQLLEAAPALEDAPKKLHPLEEDAEEPKKLQKPEEEDPEEEPKKF